MGIPFLDLLAYTQNPDEYVSSRVRKYGNVFKLNLFGRPAVLIGGQSAVKDFLKAEKSIIRPALPDTFLELHTEFGTLNQAGQKHKVYRGNAVQSSMCTRALDGYVEVIERRCMEFVDQVARRGSCQPAKELREWCTLLFGELFVGMTLDADMLRWFNDYHHGLYGLIPLKLPFTAFGRGWSAKENLIQRFEAHIENLRGSERLGEPQFATLRYLLSCKDEKGELLTTNHIAHNMLLLVWGTFTQVATMATVLYTMSSRPNVVAKAWQEVQGVPRRPAGGFALNLSELSNLKYLQAVLDETLRTMPPNGGGLRLAEKDLVIGGYRIPQGYVVSADPRISHMDPTLHEAPEIFDPDRFLKRPSAQMPEGTWFPGGIGMHGCPGILMGAILTKTLLLHWLDRFSSWGPSRESVGKENWITTPVRALAESYTMTVMLRHSAQEIGSQPRPEKVTVF